MLTYGWPHCRFFLISLICVIVASRSSGDISAESLHFFSTYVVPWCHLMHKAIITRDVRMRTRRTYLIYVYSIPAHDWRDATLATATSHWKA